MIRILKSIILVLLILLNTSNVLSQEANSGPSEWEIQVVPYLWMVGIDGDVTVRGVKSSVDVDFGDILENLDFAGEVYLQARKGKWMLFLDPTYLKVSTEAKVGPINIDAESQVWLVEFGGIYRIGGWPVGTKKERSISLDVLAGGRYWSLDEELDFRILPDVEKSEEWVDPFLGGRVRADLSERLSFLVRTDFGGFDIGSASDFSWNVLAVLGYHFSQRTSIWGGYRVLDVDYDSGSGANLFEYDVRMSGPIVGLAYRF